MKCFTPSPWGVNTPNFRTTLASSPDNPPNSSQGCAECCFYGTFVKYDTSWHSRPTQVWPALSSTYTRSYQVPENTLKPNIIMQDATKNKPCGRQSKVKKIKSDIALHGTPISELRHITCHTVLPATRHKRTHPANTSHAGWYSIYLPRRDGRLSWPGGLDSAPAGSRTSDLLITSPTPNRSTTKTTKSLCVAWRAPLISP